MDLSGIGNRIVFDRVGPSQEIRAGSKAISLLCALIQQNKTAALVIPTDLLLRGRVG